MLALAASCAHARISSIFATSSAVMNRDYFLLNANKTICFFICRKCVLTLSYLFLLLSISGVRSPLCVFRVDCAHSWLLHILFRRSFFLSLISFSFRCAYFAFRPMWIRLHFCHFVKWLPMKLNWMRTFEMRENEKMQMEWRKWLK